MKYAKIFSFSAAIIMFVAIFYGLLFADFAGEGKRILDIAWGVITLIDVYIMFSLFSLWVLYREGLTLKTLILVFLVMVLGSLTASLYTLYALIESKGDWKRFWMGINN